MTNHNGHPSRQESIKKINDLIKGIHIAMLSTADPDGTIHSRPMGTQQIEFNGDVWFFTRSSSEKVGDVERNPHVNVSYVSTGDNHYVSLSGRAQMVHDQSKIKALWNPIFKAWFPDGIDDPDLALMKVNVEHAEYWDSPNGKVVQLLGFIKAVTTGQEIDIGENEKVDLK